MSDDFNERLRQAAQAPRRLPMSYSNESGHTVGQSIPVVTASEADIRRFSDSGHVCGECHHFCDLGDDAYAGQMAQMQLLTTLVTEYEWKLHHAFPAGLPQSGLCEAHGYITQTFAVAKDCAYTGRRGKLRKATRETTLVQIRKDKDEAMVAQKAREQKFRSRFGL